MFGCKGTIHINEGGNMKKQETIKTYRRLGKRAKKEKTAVILTVFDAPNFSSKGKKAITKWLLGQIVVLTKYNKELAKRYTTRYLFC